LIENCKIENFILSTLHSPHSTYTCYNYFMKKGHFKSLSKGFSLVELLVVVAIFIIITAVVLFNQNRFSSDMSIQNLAHQVALAIRQAQVFGISVRGSSAGQTNFDIAHGVHFTTSPASFILFADNDNNGIYTEFDSLVSTFNLQNGNTIQSVCVTGSNAKCISDSETLSITFKRPNSEAMIKQTAGGPNYPGVEIRVISALRDKTMTIVVNQTGQIYVSNNSGSVIPVPENGSIGGGSGVGDDMDNPTDKPASGSSDSPGDTIGPVDNNF
jgi:prepilin-type N-terminal cleavage/methylation domain-containing protein